MILICFKSILITKGAGQNNGIILDILHNDNLHLFLLLTQNTSHIRAYLQCNVNMEVYYASDASRQSYPDIHIVLSRRVTYLLRDSKERYAILDFFVV